MKEQYSWLNFNFEEHRKYARCELEELALKAQELEEYKILCKQLEKQNLFLKKILGVKISNQTLLRGVMTYRRAQNVRKNNNR